MRKSRKWLILVGILLVVATACLAFGFWLAGFDVLGWFGSQSAMFLYIVLGLYALIVAYVLIKDKLDNSY